jgi:hypothetical protein
MEENNTTGLKKVEEGIVVNVDNASLKSYKMKKERERKFNSLMVDVENLKREVAELKASLDKLNN